MGILSKLKQFFSGEKEDVYIINIDSHESSQGIKSTAVYGNKEGYRCCVKKDSDNGILSIMLTPPGGKGEAVYLPNKKSIERKIVKGTPMSKLYAKYKAEEGKHWVKEVRKNYKDFSDAQKKIDECIKKMEQATPREMAQIGSHISKLKDVILQKRQEIDESYDLINPSLARLRREESAKIYNGADPKVAGKERRQAVAAYYKKKESQNE